MTSLFTLYRWGVQEIFSVAPETAEYETALLIEKFFGISRTRLLSFGKEIFPKDEDTFSYKEAVKKRVQGQPLQYILGEWEFYGLKFKVGRGVLVPRADTETLVDEAVEYLGRIKRENPERKLRILDLCSGSGCIAISVGKKFPKDEVLALELMDVPLEYLKENIAQNGAQNVTALKGDMLTDYNNFGDFDLILSNPPYIPKDDIENLSKEVKNEPVTALDGGEDGLDFYRVLGANWTERLKKGGAMMVEIGIGQESEVEELFSKNLNKVYSKKDLNGIYRIVVGHKE